MKPNVAFLFIKSLHERCCNSNDKTQCTIQQIRGMNNRKKVKSLLFKFITT